MRVLFAAHPAIGHFLPLVPLAWAFQTAGHEALVAIALHHDLAARSGLEVVNVAPDFDLDAIFAEAAREHPEFMKPVDPKHAINIEEFAGPLAAVNRPMVERLVALADDWRPDLVVYDQATTAGLIAAGRLGVPAVQRNISGWRTNKMHERAAFYLADLCERYGVSVPSPDLTVECFPPSMLAGQEPEGWFMRWMPYSGGGVLGDRLPQPPPDRPRVAVTMGTIELQSFGVSAMESLVAEAAKVDAEFVLALGDDIDVGPLGALPPNVRSVGWMPLNALLRTCTAIVHHGGGGTALAAIDAGLPQLLAPHPRDAFQRTVWNAVAQRGIGLVSQPEDVDAALLNRLIADEGLRAATAEVRAEMIGLPTVEATARRIAEHIGQ